MKIHSTNVLERLNGEIKRRSDVVGIFPNERAIRRLVGALLLEQNDELILARLRALYWLLIAVLATHHQASHRYERVDRELTTAYC